MKIVYITMQFPVPSETFLSLDVETLQNQGHEIMVFGLRPRHRMHNSLMRERNHGGLLVENLSLITLLNALKFFVLSPRKSASLLNWVVMVSGKKPRHLLKSLMLLPSVLGHFDKVYRSKPDVVHLFWGHYPTMLGFLVKRYMPGTVVSQFLGAHDLIAGYPGSAALAEEVDLLFTHSKSNIPIIQKLGINAESVNVVLRGTKLSVSFDDNIQKFSNMPHPSFLAAGRLIKGKGFDDVIRTFKLVLDTSPEAHLIIAGDGPARADLLNFAKKLGCNESISFIGHISHSKLLEIMAETHFFLLLSRYRGERLPNVLKEAMYQNCVVITSETEGISELIDAGIDGFVVPMHDYNLAYNIIQKCLSSEIFPKSIASRAKEKICKKFDVNVSMSKYVSAWQLALKRNGHIATDIIRVDKNEL